ncbi:MAG TPA: glucokinase [Bacteroidales bacterium]|nr:MAG: glucokinase [Bacteroidetes bacterium GWF2_33_38]OFY76397.1 MAG: glucokinase [Bacteroidetes bacterium RIFOXYA12_FULL_33_9]OFY88609.1 MAG: glucokinase [Bacteroidetes bacterium RIFOXYA2_FULL_33_7]HBF88145.1 glucokinase [Bacteroidales bacterium]
MKQQMVIGIDIGGTNTVVGLVNKDGECTENISFSTKQGNSFEDYFTIFVKNISDLITKNKDVEIIGFGIGAPNANYYTGIVENAPNLNWHGTIKLKQIVEQAFKVPTYITNDANAAAIGEMLFGGAKNMKEFVVITLGTGLGSGFVTNGNVLYGYSGFAGELGHTTVVKDGRQCGCGRKGCLETYVSATGITRTMIELLENKTVESELRNYNINEITSKHIFDAAKNGDKLAIEAFEFTGEMLGLSLANMVAITSPEAIFLFGGLAQSGDFIFKPTIKSFNENLLTCFTGTVKILESGLKGNMTAVLGSAALCWNELNK